MPTYAYKCTGCRHRFEVFQRITEDPLESCPKCGKPIKRLILGGTGIIFKGSGFYVNDSRKSGDSTSGADSSSSAKKESKTDSKGEPKSDSASATKQSPGTADKKKTPSGES